jgi:Ca2+-binding EF-hand superfamily protein
MSASSQLHSLFVVVLAAALQTAAAAAEIDADRLFGDLDANDDGQVTAGEVGEEQRLLFKRLARTGDADGDGKLSAEEFAAALQPVRAEKSLVEKQGSRLPGADALTVLMAKMDANADRRIDADEVPEAYARAFEQFLRPGDGDKDGNLDAREIGKSAPRLSIIAQLAARRMGLDVPAELAKIPAEQTMAMDQMDAYARPVEMMADPAQAEQMFKRLDANGDKQLVAEEAPGPFADRFAEMVERGDADGDKQLSRKEFLAMSRRLAEFESARPDPQAVRQAYRQLLKRFDGDGDGQLSVREAPPRIAENFDRADADANGKLDEAELKRVAETMARMQKFAGGRGFGRPAMESEEPADSTDSPRKKGAKRNRKSRPAS